MARRFVFKLETLLKLRRQREEQQKRVVAERLRQIAQIRREIAMLDRQIAEQIAAMRGDAGQMRLDVMALARGRLWLSHLQRGRLDADGHLRALEARLAQERAVLSHASKEKKIVEKLKERQYLRYRSDLERQETLAGDELATVRYLRERRVAGRCEA